MVMTADRITGQQQTTEHDGEAEFKRLLEKNSQLEAEVKEARMLGQMEFGDQGLDCKNSAQAWWLAGIFFRAGAAPKDDESVKDGNQWRKRGEQEIRSRLFLKIAFGGELGLKPLQAIQSVAIINNRPTLWGDAMKALVISTGRAEYIYEKEIGEKGKPSYGFECRTKRKGQEEEVTTFTVQDAMTAGLMNKPGDLYKLYPQRMLMFRARGFRLRDTYPDVLKGVISAEEAKDEQRLAEQAELRVLKQMVPRASQVIEIGDTGGNGNVDAHEQANGSPHEAGEEAAEDIERETEPLASPTAPPRETEDPSAIMDGWKVAIESASDVGTCNDLEAKITTAPEQLRTPILDMLLSRKQAIRSKRGGRKASGEMFDTTQGYE